MNSASVRALFAGNPFLDHVIEKPILMCLVVLVAGMLIHFFVQYLLRGMGLRLVLKKLTGKVTGVKEAQALEVKSRLQDVFDGSRAQFAWREYEETLHEQYEYIGGERRAVAVRATVPAQNFINVETVVDPWLGSEYFKHLPGILTGLGIIGTFYGLINGLQQFDPTNLGSTTGSDLSNLKGLFSEVEYAFTFSGFAIGAAILVTIIEKWLFSSCAKWTGELTQALDGLFRAGVGEEYLSSLVQASQESASQTKQLKESLVDDLKVLLTNLTERQVEATRQMTTDFAAQIHRSLEQPLQQIAETVRMASGQQTQAAGAALENLIAAFMAQMRESVGAQMGDLSALLAQTASSMSQVELTMRSLVSDMAKAGGAQSEAVSAAMRELLAKLDEHQQQQEKTVSASTRVVMDKMQQAVARMAEAQEASIAKSQAAVEHAVGAIQGRVDGLVLSTQDLAKASQESSARVQLGANEAIVGLASAASNVESAVRSMGAVADRMTELASRMTGLEAQALQASQSSTAATTNLAAATQAMVGTTAKLGETAARLEAVGRVALTEAADRAALVKDLERAAQFSRDAATEFTGLSEQVKTHLIENVETFGGAVGQVLSKHLTDYQKQLGDAVSMLRNALEELSEYADSARE